jgi:phage-related protein
VADEFPTLEAKLTALYDEFTAGLEGALGEAEDWAESVSEIAPDIGVNTAQLTEGLTDAAEQIDALREDSADIPITGDSAGLDAAVTDAAEKIGALQDDSADIPITANTADLTAAIDDASAQVTTFDDLVTGTVPVLDLDSAPLTEKLAEASAGIEALRTQGTSIPVTADTSDLVAKVAAASMMTSAFTDNPKVAKIQANIDDLTAKMMAAHAAVDDVESHPAVMELFVEAQQAFDEMRSLQEAKEKLTYPATGVFSVDDTDAKQKYREAMQAREDLIQTITQKLEADASGYRQGVAEAKGALGDLVGELNSTKMAADSATLEANLGFVDTTASMLAAGGAAVGLGSILTALIPIGGLIGLGFANGVGAANKSTDQFRVILMATAEALVPLENVATGSFFKAFDYGFESLGESFRTLGGSLNNLAPVISDIAGDFGTFFGDAAAALAQFLPSWLDFTRASMQGLATMGPALDTVGKALVAVFEDLTQSGAAEKAMQGLGQVIDAFLPLLPPLIDTAVKLAAVLGPSIAQAVGLAVTVLNALLDIVGSNSKAFGIFFDVAGTVVLSIKAINMVADTGHAILETYNAAVGLIGGAWDAAAKVGAMFASELDKGVQYAQAMKEAQEGLTAATEAGTAAEVEFDAAAMANPVGLIIVAVVALIAVIATLVMNWGGARDMLVEGCKEIGQAFVTMGQAIVDIFKTIWDGITAPFKEIGQVVSSAISGISGIFSSGMQLMLPQYADGGPVPGTGPQLAVVHGGEYVVSQAMMSGAAPSGVSLGSAGAAGGGTTVVESHLYLDGEQLRVTMQRQFLRTNIRNSSAGLALASGR